MSRFTQPLTNLIHENLSVIATFAFSRSALEALREREFLGTWKYLDRALFAISEQRAAMACLELATLIRLLDDDEHVGSYLRQRGDSSFGRVVKQAQPDEPLYLRDLTNKIIHAHHLEWDISDPGHPKLICVSRHPERWVKAEVLVIALAEFCGELMAS